MNGLGKEVTIVMIEDDEGHARLIEKNIRRAGVHNEVEPFTNGTDALDFVLGKDRTGLASAGRFLLICGLLVVDKDRGDLARSSNSAAPKLSDAFVICKSCMMIL